MTRMFLIVTLLAVLLGCATAVYADQSSGATTVLPLAGVAGPASGGASVVPIQRYYWRGYYNYPGYYYGYRTYSPNQYYYGGYPEYYAPPTYYYYPAPSSPGYWGPYGGATYYGPRRAWVY
jgi:hypothetical protein